MQNFLLSRDFAAETLREEEGEPEAAARPEPVGYSRSKKRTLEELFKPPLDIMHQVARHGPCTCTLVCLLNDRFKCL
jgi:hypothetical protein